MGAVIGQLLPLGVGVAISPIPIIAVILLLMSDRASVNGLAFAVGWIVGLTVVTVVVLLFTDVSTERHGSSGSTGSAIVQTVAGVVLLALAVLQWRARGRATEPKWMQAAERFNLVTAGGLGLLLAGNFKNLLLSLEAGVVIGTGELQAGATVLAVAVFVIIGSTTIAGPVAYYLVSPGRAKPRLETWRSWLTAHTAAVLTVLFLVLGSLQLGEGIAGLS